MRLSRKGWNNVLIFAILLMVLLFQVAQKHLPASGSAKSILPAKAHIVALTVGDRQWQLKQGQWQCGEKPCRSPLIAQVVERWQLWQLPLWQKPVGGAADTLPLSFTLDSQAEPVELTLFSMGDRHLLSNWQGKLLLLSPDDYAELLAPLRAPH